MPDQDQREAEGLSEGSPIVVSSALLPRIGTFRCEIQFVNTLHLEEKLREEYDPIAEVYRQNDELDAQGRDHQRVARKLEALCQSFGRPIQVLDLGCGTGRYFYCLKNVERLVGVDVSERMLRAALHPLREDDVSAEEIELRRENLYTAAFPAGLFDLIYSVGVFGNGCALTRELCDAVYSWLKPGGKFFFDAIDTSDLPRTVRWRKKVRAGIHAVLPEPLQRAWDRRSGWMPFFMATEKDLWRLLCKTRFTEIELRPEPAQLTLGAGIKLECVCGKPLPEVSATAEQF